jgi:hypothetical protein
MEVEVSPRAQFARGLFFIQQNYLTSRPDRILHSREVLEEMERMGYRAARGDEVDWGEKREWPVVVLGSPEESPLAHDHALYLDGLGRCYYDVKPFDQRWPDGVRFAAVKLKK